MDVLSAARAHEAAGRHIVHMEIGEPGFPAPASVRAAAAAALESGRIGYTEALGLPALRERIARHYGEFYGLDVSPARIAVTTGSSGGFILAFLASFDAGDRIAITSPGYPPYRTLIQSLGLVPVEIAVDEKDRWSLTGDAIERAHAQAPLAGVLIMSPANPTGTVIAPDVLAGIAATCRTLGIRLVSDEIYHGLTYGAPTDTALRFDPECVVANSFSKYWCMTGWRIGWLVVPEALSRTFERLAQSLFISVPTLSQVAAIAALDATAELEQVRAIYARNRAVLLDRLPAMGYDRILPADGAFYLYLDVSRHTNDSAAMARAILDEAGVAITPGVDFDRERGHLYLRLSFAGAEADITEAMDRLERWTRR